MRIFSIVPGIGLELLFEVTSMLSFFMLAMKLLSADLQVYPVRNGKK
jgi:hypothetical protein